MCSECKVFGFNCMGVLASIYERWTIQYKIQKIIAEMFRACVHETTHTRKS